MQCLPALILVSGKRNSSGISLQRVTGQTESEFFGGSRVVPMGEREREKARYIVAVPTGTNKQNFSFFWRNPKSQKRSGEPARDGFSVDRPSIRLGFGFVLPPSSLCASPIQIMHLATRIARIALLGSFLWNGRALE